MSWVVKLFVAGTDISEFQSFKTPDDALRYENRMNEVIGTLEQVRIMARVPDTDPDPST